MIKTKQQKIMIDSYNQLYKGKNFRETWEGEISLRYKMPKYVSLFIECLQNKNPTILEIGAGDGYLTKLITKKLKCKKYVATEMSEEGVKRLEEKGIESLKMNAEKLDFPDNSFDIVCAFDVMHHVTDPGKMASEMLRVAKKSIFLIESNGLCIIRRLLEKTAKYKMVDEKSYTPKKYASLFVSEKVKKISIKPFLAVFPFTNPILIRPAVWISEIMERLPILKWQCSSLLITISI